VIQIDRRAVEVTMLERDGVMHLHGRSGWHAFRLLEVVDASIAGEVAGVSGDGPLTAPVPGVVASVAVVAGDRVVAGEPLLVLESMKMLQTINAPAQAWIAAVHCAAGDAVVAGQVLLVLEVSGDSETVRNPS
jgi:biotin carboxyl carrier protein